MRIRYEVTAQDHVAFALHHRRLHDKETRRSELIGIWLIIGIVVLATALPAWNRHETTRAGAYVGIGVLVGMVWPDLARRGRRIRLERTALTLGRGSLGVFEMAITERGVVVQTSWGETSTWWHGILDVETTPEHLFVRTSAISAHIVPKARILQGNVADLESALRDGLARQRIPAPAADEPAGGEALPSTRNDPAR